jgi:hypothetical protein
VHLLASLHCHCMQLLAQACDCLPAETCTLGQQPRASSSSSSAGDSSSNRPPAAASRDASAQQQQQQQQQQQAWRLCLAQVRHNLLLLLQLSKLWQEQHRQSALQRTFDTYQKR